MHCNCANAGLDCELPAVASNLPILASLNNQRSDLRGSIGDILVRRGLRIRCGIEFCADILKVPTSCRSHLW